MKNIIKNHKIANKIEKIKKTRTQFSKYPSIIPVKYPKIDRYLNIPPLKVSPK